MSEVAIGRWHNRYTTADRAAPDEIRGWDAAPRCIEPPALPGTDGLVLIRALRVATVARHGEGAAALSARLESAFARALEAAVAEAPRGAVVRYESLSHALADMLYRAACGDSGRAWAWRQLGLLPAGTESPAAARAAALGALTGHPSLIWPVLARIISAEDAAGSLTAVAAALRDDELLGLVGAAPQAAGLPEHLQHVPTPPKPAEPPPAPRTPLAMALLGWSHRNPALARRHRAALVRLIAALDRPATADADALVSVERAAAQFTAAVDGPAPAAGVLRDPPAKRPVAPIEPERGAQARPSPDDALSAPAAPAATPSMEAMAAPDLPAGTAVEWTAWGGALFLLPLLPATAFVERLANAAAPLLPALAALLAGIGIPVEDALVRALCGPVETREQREPPDGLVTETLASLDALLELRLGPSGQEEPWLKIVCRRAALLSVELGWIEASFALDSVDLRLRRGALDLDPGWIPWLGSVVKYCYV
jgi:hypothetical protein